MIYTIHMCPDDRLDQAVAVRDGFCWGGVFFGWLWAVFYRMIWVAVVLFLAVVIIGTAWVLLIDWPVLLIGLATIYVMIVGCCGHAWRRLYLAYKGYRWVGLIAARNRDDALYRFWQSLDEGRVPSMTDIESKE